MLPFSRRGPVWLRFVLVPGLTDDPAEVEQIARFAGSLGNVEAPSAEVVERVCEQFRAVGLKTY